MFFVENDERYFETIFQIPFLENLPESWNRVCQVKCDLSHAAFDELKKYNFEKGTHVSNEHKHNHKYNNLRCVVCVLIHLFLWCSLCFVILFFQGLASLDIHIPGESHIVSLELVQRLYDILVCFPNLSDVTIECEANGTGSNHNVEIYTFPNFFLCLTCWPCLLNRFMVFKYGQNDRFETTTASATNQVGKSRTWETIDSTW